jgi:polysaccharide pyruvyl transferase WcaK-like protein
MKILMGGIPLGCDNIGDEAIIDCAVGIVRRNVPDAEITVCTADPDGTAKRLQVAAAPLFGFDPGYPAEEFARFAAGFDLYIWSGATGLSDYPAMAIRLLEAARSVSVPALLWAVGMDSELNPAYFRLGGKKKKLLSLLSLLTLNLVRLDRLIERLQAAKMRKAIARTLEYCPLVVVRDRPSEEELVKCGFRRAQVGADSAILQPSHEQHRVEREAGVVKIGFCVSAQRGIADRAGLLALLDRITADPARRIVFIPMNPKTDLELMQSLRQELNHPERTILLENCVDPGEVQSVAGACDVVVSSRLHLLILAANADTPIVGVSRGSKIDNFLAEFRLKSAGTVYDCDFDGIYENILRFTAGNSREKFKDTAAAAREKLFWRLESAEAELRSTIETLRKKDQRPQPGIDGAAHEKKD